MYRPSPLRGRHSVLEGKKVLLIDNNQPTRDVRVSVLRSHGIEVEPAANFSSARSLQRLHHYDWIFLDVRRHFPGEALQFYEQIKDASPGQRFAFLVGPPVYLTRNWPRALSVHGSWLVDFCCSFQASLFLETVLPSVRSWRSDKSGGLSGGQYFQASVNIDTIGRGTYPECVRLRTKQEVV